MTRANFGPKARQRTQHLLEAIIGFANYEIPDQDRLGIECTRKSDHEIIVKSKLQPLVDLTASVGQELTREQIKDSLHCLEDVGILKDLRVKSKGNPWWYFSLTLWYSLKDKDNNLDCFQQEWEKLKKNNKILTQNTPQTYNDRAIQDYLEGNLPEAVKGFKQAIALDSNFAVAQYNLGCIYDQLQAFEQASYAYHQAILGGLGAAYNNLGRLFILQKKYPQGVNLLLQGLENAQCEQDKYAIWKNLGWIRLEQKRYLEAESWLLQALEMGKKQGAIQCLLAQTWEGLGKWQQAKLAYENCLRYASCYKLEEDEWINIARQKIE